VPAEAIREGLVEQAATNHRGRTVNQFTCIRPKTR
jgi:hypothetical protein